VEEGHTKKSTRLKRMYERTTSFYNQKWGDRWKRRKKKTVTEGAL
jgi:hypothetical protein